MKKAVTLVTTVLMLLLLSVSAFAVEQGVDVSQKVYDYAALFTEEQTAKLKEKSLALKEATNNDIVILTIKRNDKSSALVYAEDFYDENGFGTGETHNGILLIIDMDQRILQTITTGEGDQSSLYQIIDPDRLSDMEDTIQSYLTAGDYYGGASFFLDETERYFSMGADESFWAQYYNDSGFRDQYDRYDPEQPNGTQPAEPLSLKDRFVDSLPFSVVAAAVVTAGVLLVLYKKNRASVLAKSADNYAAQNSFQLTRSEDVFLTTKTVAMPIQQNPSSGSTGGGFHTGSSGTSHGTGGGRSF